MAKPNKVSWHKTGRWYFSKTIEGKKKPFYASPEIPNTPNGRRKATEWMNGMLKSFEDRVITDGDWSLDDLRLTYLTWCKRRVAEKAAKPHTLEGHRKHLNLICRTPWGGKTLGNLLVRDLTTKVVGDLIRAWKTPTTKADGTSKPGKGATTIRNRIGSLQAMLNWASRPRDDRSIERLIPTNPIAGYELPKAEYQGDRYAPAEEVDAFLAWVEKRAGAVEGAFARFERMTAMMIRVAAETGARPGEICAMEWRHYDAEERLITFPPDEHKTGRKTRRDRQVLIGDELAGRLETLRADPERHPTHVFTHSTRRLGSTEKERRCGDPWNSNALSRRVKELRREAIASGVPLEDQGVKRMHLYRLRHTHITGDMQSKNPSIAAVAAMHGTSAKMIEQTYLHFQTSHLREIRDQIDAAKKAEGGA